MKKIVLAAAMTLVAFHAFAGGMNAPVEEPQVSIETIENDVVSSDGGILVPIFALVMFAAALAD